jgi:hypothetical protein
MAVSAKLAGQRFAMNGPLHYIPILLEPLGPLRKITR